MFSFSSIRYSAALSFNSLAVFSSIPSIFEISSIDALWISSIEENPSATKSCPSVSSNSKFFTKISVLSLNSNCLFSDSSFSVSISISKSINFDANLTFWPLLPIALLKFSSVKITSIFLFWSSIITFWISAGAKALTTRGAPSSDQWNISIF